MKNDSFRLWGTLLIFVNFLINLTNFVIQSEIFLWIFLLS